MVQPGLYFRSGPSGLVPTLFPIADLAILNPYSDLLSRIVEYKAPTWDSILTLMAELEDVAHYEAQVSLLTRVVDRNTNEDEASTLSNSDGEDSDVSVGGENAELEQAFFRSNQKRTLLPNNMSTALEGFEELSCCLRTVKGHESFFRR